MDEVMGHGDVKITHDCFEAAVDAYGKKISDAKCVIWATDQRNFLEVNDTLIGTMMVETIIEVDAGGVRLITPTAFDTDICYGVPQLKSVDGKRIDQLPMDDQITAVLNGSIYVRETDRPWPYCNVYSEGTRLTGIKEAYEQMMMEWRNRWGG
jgi:hypothetical protein